MTDWHDCLDGVYGRVSWAPSDFLGGDSRALLATGSGDHTARLWRLPRDSNDNNRSSNGSSGGGGSGGGGGMDIEAAAVLKGHPEEVYSCEFLRGSQKHLVCSYQLRIL